MAQEVDTLPGFTATENADGTFTIKNVPVFVEHTVRTPDGEVRIGSSWMDRAIMRSERRFKEDAYLAPLHVNHHGTGREVRRAGFFRPRSRQIMTFEGRELSVLFADLVAIQPDVFKEIESGRLPYRSVEIHRINPADGEAGGELDSCALMADEVPFFRLPILRVSKIEQSESIGLAERFSAGAAPALAYRAYGKAGCSVLFNLGGVEASFNNCEGKMTEPEKDEEQNPALMQESDPLPEEPKDMADEEEEVQMGSDDKLAKMKGLIEEMMGLFEDDEPEEEEEGAEAPAPVEMSASAPRESAVSYSTREIELMARADKSEAEISALKRRNEQADVIDGLVKDLAEQGFDASIYRDRLVDLAKKSISSAKVYASAIKENVDPDPAPTFEAYDGGAVEGEVQVFTALGTDGMEAAVRYGREYDELKKRLPLKFSKQEHIKGCLSAEGFDLGSIEFTTNGKN